MIQRGLRRLLWPSFVYACLIATPGGRARAQDPVRPWLEWRTLSMEKYRFHYLREFEGWTRDVAKRIEAVDSAIAAHVGWSVPTPMHVVVDDPFAVANGYAIPFLDRPVTVWWASPADPRNDIGNYRTWGEMLSVHELTHIAHLARPSRNGFQRALWRSLPANFGPITLKTPRWAYEGYATVIEGRITGSGRPNNAWRPAILRQWAIEGRLPSYGQLAAWSDFTGGEFAYLGGSAYLEWLLQRQGDSSLVHVWRRLTAKQARSFETAFRGVYGETPSALYGVHVAELTRDAMAAKATLERAGLVQGELIQRLTWSTGDPAISANGERVAIVLRERERPARLVVWTSTPEPEDTAALRRRIDNLRRDPHDVPDRRFYPLAKKAEKTLLAREGRSFQMPRWYADNRRILATRWTARQDGTLSPALYEWNTESGDVRRVTQPVGVLHADPHPNMREAVAMQCHWGHCDIVSVDLERGAVRTLLEGTPDRTYYRPRYSPSADRFVASVLDAGQWKLLVARPNGDVIRLIDAGDGANRYDAQWLTADTLVVVSERGGIPNVEKIDVATGAATSVTRVTGAAVAPDVNRRDGSIWFLSLHSRGLDVRRLAAGAPLADTAVAVSFARYAFAGTRDARTVALTERTTAMPGRYRGLRQQRWIPGAYYSADGAGGFLSIYNGDIIGRLTGLVTGAYGENGTWQGGSLRAVWRGMRPTVELGVHAYVHEPSLGRWPNPTLGDSIDGTVSQGVLAIAYERSGEWMSLKARAGGSAGRFRGGAPPEHQRLQAFGELSARFQQQRGARGVYERLSARGSLGTNRDRFERILGSLTIGTLGRDMLPLEGAITVGRVGGHPHPFELFAIGGAEAPVTDSSLLTQRYALPMFPTGASVGRSLLAWRVAVPGPWTVFYEASSTAPDVWGHADWHRAVGSEIRFSFPNMPVAFLPRVDARVGAAYVLDEPFRKRVRAFASMKLEP